MNNIFKNQLDKIVFIVFTLLALSLIWNTVDAIYRNYKLQAKVGQLTQEIELLELENENLKHRIVFYKTDAYADLALRERGNVASPGEKVVLFEKDIQPDYDNLDSEYQEDISDDQNKSNFQKWLDFFSGA